MKIALAQQNYHIGNFTANLDKMKMAVDEARRQNADIIVFSELSVCGYPPRDFLEFDDFVDQCYRCMQELATYAIGMGVLAGGPFRNPEKEGKDLFNSAWFLADGKPQQIFHKSLLPTYDVFDEYRYFEPGKNFELLEYQGKKIAITICEDIWNIGNENPLYTISPMDELVKKKPDMMINLSASPFDYEHAQERIAQVKANALRYNLPVFYVNAVGTQTEIVFDGGSCVVDADGSLIDECPYFEEVVRVYDTEKLSSKGSVSNLEQSKDKTALIQSALVCGIRDYFSKMNFKKAILGMSGGVDSALTLALAVEAMGKENVLPVMLPSQYSSEGSVSDSLEMCRRLSVEYKIIPIEEAFQSFLHLLEPHFQDLPFNVAEENIQSRSRAVILMGLANKLGYILLNTTNKSEAAVGYGTLYGDMCGGISVLGDVYKTEVYAICDYINREKSFLSPIGEEPIPRNILTKAPSAELRPNQKDSDSLPDYDVLDQVLYRYIEKRSSLKDMEKMGLEGDLVRRVMKLVNSNEWKGHQMAPVIRVSPKSFGVGRRMPIVAHYGALG